MLIRLSRLGQLDLCDEVLLHYRRHGQNSGALPSVPRQAWLVRCIAFHSDENTPAERRLARRGWRAYQVHLAVERLHAVRGSTGFDAVCGLLALALHLPAYALRYVRGYPLPRARRPRLRW